MKSKPSDHQPVRVDGQPDQFPVNRAERARAPRTGDGGGMVDVVLKPIDTPMAGCRAAKAVAVAVTTLQAMKKAGYKFTHAGKTTPRSVLKWLEAHPDFRVSHVYPSGARTKRGPARRPSRAGKLDALLSSYVEPVTSQGARALRHAPTG